MNETDRDDARMVARLQAALEESRRAAALIAGYDELIGGMFRFIRSLTEERDLLLLKQGIDERLETLHTTKNREAK